MALIGRSGSGKSVMLRELLTPYRRVIVLDPKRRADYGGWAIVEGAHAGGREWPRHHERIIARPLPMEDERAWADHLCRAAYYVGSCAVGLDETAGIATETSPLPHLELLLKRGRDPGPQGPITTYVATQRPRRVPVSLLSEADVALIFDLNMPADRDFIREVIGAYERPRIRHGFWYWTPDLDAAIECEPLRL